jgi:hypothetical protein
MPQVTGPSSFIPKKPVDTSSGSSTVSRKKSTNALNLVGGIIFVLALVAAGGVFAFKSYVRGQVDSKSKQLQQAQANIQTEVIEEILAFDTRLQVSEELLKSHTTVLPLFTMIENRTLKDVQFTSFEFTGEPGQPAEVKLAGVTDSYPMVALQADEFGKSEYVRDPIVSDFVLTPEGKVTFNATFTVDPGLLLYSQRLDQ